MTLDDDLVEVVGLSGIQGLQRQVVKDEQIDADIGTLVRRRKGESGRAGAARLLEAVAQGLAPITVLP